MSNDMRACVICELNLDDSEFNFSEYICDKCFKRLKKEPDYNKGGSRYTTVRMAYILLLQAIRNQAIADGKLEDFEDYWLKSSVLKDLWGYT